VEPTYSTLGWFLSDDTYWVTSCEGLAFGCLASELHRCLKTLTQLQCVEVDVIVPFAALAQSSATWRESGSSPTIKVELNIYGHLHHGKAVSRELFDLKLYLQPPIIDFRSLVYDNPQDLKLPEIQLTSLQGTQSIIGHGTFEDLDMDSTDVGSVLDNLTQPSFPRVRTSLVKYVKVLRARGVC
jgi:hypothetical protein